MVRKKKTGLLKPDMVLKKNNGLPRLGMVPKNNGLPRLVMVRNMVLKKNNGLLRLVMVPKKNNGLPRLDMVAPPRNMVASPNSLSNP